MGSPPKWAPCEKCGHKLPYGSAIAAYVHARAHEGAWQTRKK